MDTLDEYTFGNTACLIKIDPQPNAAGTGAHIYIARAFVFDNGGRALREVADPQGRVVVRANTDLDTVRAQMVAYLEPRFGERAEESEDALTAPDVAAVVRPINGPPLKDDRPPSRYGAA
jgi:hypothetical protein